ncbi:hypothetical protein JJC03_08275 [Flavobacterium oreochromis]|uniref:hypothetical protein n=1 Tax=Flavobacterium oreochromis TaxID=2906078 RepID=UPI001CE5702A|nr:hypothetical protein [Flavobacterium oreochromis]QYS87732.1 hypothetical protein JJC03_08275 [Flavobacterium oreochromis]
MTRVLILGILFFSIISCKSQDKKEKLIIKKDSMEYFNKEYYANLKIDPSVNMKVLPNGDHVVINEFIEPTKETILDIHKKNSPFIDYFVYYGNSRIKAIGSLFYNIPSNIQKEFDQSGNLIKETDYEKNYKFSIEDLCRLIKTDYDIDLMVPSNSNIERGIQYYVNRSKIEFYPGFAPYIYEVNLYIQDGGGAKAIVINGNTGEILFEEYKSGFATETLPQNKRIRISTKEEFIKRTNNSSIK